MNENNWTDLYQNYRSALSRLVELTVLDLTPNGMKDALIHRYEYTYELAWKVLKDYLKYYGYKDINSPLEVLRTAFKAELLTMLKCGKKCIKPAI